MSVTASRLRAADKVVDALKAARRVIELERRSQFDSYTMPSVRKRLDEAYAAMSISERAAIVRFDRVLVKIKKALWTFGITE